MNGRTTQPLRVVFVQSYTGLGGAETALANLLRHLPRETIHAEVVSLEYGNGLLLEKLARNGVSVSRYAAGRFRSLHRTFAATRWLARKIRRERFDIVVANGGHPNLYARPAALWAGCRSVWWVHDTCFADRMENGALGVLQSWVRADLLVANSGFTKRILRREFPAAWIETISPGVDLRETERARASRRVTRAALGLASTDFAVGMFARYQRGKGHHVVLQTAAALCRRGFPGCFLFVGGSVPWLEPGCEDEMKSLAKKLGIQDRVRFLGARENAKELMAACDAVVHASIRPESYGLVVAEAMAVGVPVVATTIGGPLELIAVEETGLLVPPGDVAALATALMRLVQDPALGLRLAKNAYICAHARFGAEGTAARFSDIFQRLAGTRQPTRMGAEEQACIPQ